MNNQWNSSQFQQGLPSETGQVKMFDPTQFQTPAAFGGAGTNKTVSEAPQQIAGVPPQQHVPSAQAAPSSWNSWSSWDWNSENNNPQGGDKQQQGVQEANSVISQNQQIFGGGVADSGYYGADQYTGEWNQNWDGVDQYSQPQQTFTQPETGVPYDQSQQHQPVQNFQQYAGVMFDQGQDSANDLSDQQNQQYFGGQIYGQQQQLVGDQGHVYNQYQGHEQYQGQGQSYYDQPYNASMWAAADESEQLVNDYKEEQKLSNPEDAGTDTIDEQQVSISQNTTTESIPPTTSGSSTSHEHVLLTAPSLEIYGNDDDGTVSGFFSRDCDGDGDVQLDSQRNIQSGGSLGNEISSGINQFLTVALTFHRTNSEISNASLSTLNLSFGEDDDGQDPLHNIQELVQRMEEVDLANRQSVGKNKNVDNPLVRDKIKIEQPHIVEKNWHIQDSAVDFGQKQTRGDYSGFGNATDSHSTLPSNLLLDKNVRLSSPGGDHPGSAESGGSGGSSGLVDWEIVPSQTGLVTQNHNSSLDNCVTLFSDKPDGGISVFNDLRDLGHEGKPPLGSWNLSVSVTLDQSDHAGFQNPDSSDHPSHHNTTSGRSGSPFVAAFTDHRQEEPLPLQTPSQVSTISSTKHDSNVTSQVLPPKDGTANSFKKDAVKSLRHSSAQPTDQALLSNNLLTLPSEVRPNENKAAMSINQRSDSQRSQGLASIPSEHKLSTSSLTEDGNCNSRRDSNQSIKSTGTSSAHSRRPEESPVRSSSRNSEVSVSSQQRRHHSAFHPVSRSRQTALLPATTLWDNSEEPGSNILLAPAMPLIISNLNPYPASEAATTLFVKAGTTTATAGTSTVATGKVSVATDGNVDRLRSKGQDTAAGLSRIEGRDNEKKDEQNRSREGGGKYDKNPSFDSLDEIDAAIDVQPTDYYGNHGSRPDSRTDYNHDYYGRGFGYEDYNAYYDGYDPYAYGYGYPTYDEYNQVFSYCLHDEMGVDTDKNNNRNKYQPFFRSRGCGLRRWRITQYRVPVICLLFVIFCLPVLAIIHILFLRSEMNCPHTCTCSHDDIINVTKNYYLKHYPIMGTKYRPDIKIMFETSNYRTYLGMFAPIFQRILNINCSLSDGKAYSVMGMINANDKEMYQYTTLQVSCLKGETLIWDIPASHTSFNIFATKYCNIVPTDSNIQNYISIPINMWIIDIENGGRNILTLMDIKFTQNILTLAINGSHVSTIPKHWHDIYLVSASIISLQNTGIEEFDCPFRLKKILDTLNLEGNRLAHFPECIIHSNNIRLNYLSLESNVISDLMPLYEVPEMSCISDISVINLSFNQIRSIEAIRNMCNLVVLDLSHNAIRDISENAFEYLFSLEELYLGHNNIHAVGPHQFTNNIRLSNIVLSHNFLTMVLPEQFPPKSPSIILDVRQNMLIYPPFRDCAKNKLKNFNFTIYSAGNPFFCDCHMLEFENCQKWVGRNIANYTKEKNMYKDVGQMICTAPEENKGVSLMDISFHSKCIVIDGCPGPCYCALINTESLVVNCSARQLLEMPDSLPSYSNASIILYLDHNPLQRLSHRPYLRVLSELHADNCLIASITPTAMMSMQNIRVLILHNNLLQKLPSSTCNLTLKHALNVTLYNNRWECKCDSLWLPKWLINHEPSLWMPGSIACHDLCKPVEEFTELDVNCNFSSYIDTFLTISLTLLCFVSTLIIVLCNRSEISELLYSNFGFLNILNPYDACVYYSIDSCNWVLTTFVPLLENGPINYRLCLHYRDFTTKNSWSVRHSRYSFLVLSKDITNTRLQYTNLWAAFLHLQHGTNKFMIIAVDDINIDELPTDLCRYMHTNRYLKAEEQNFFDNLVLFLPAKKQTGYLQVVPVTSATSSADVSSVLSSRQSLQSVSTTPSDDF